MLLFELVRSLIITLILVFVPNRAMWRKLSVRRPENDSHPADMKIERTLLSIVFRSRMFSYSNSGKCDQHMRNKYLIYSRYQSYLCCSTSSYQYNAKYVLLQIKYIYGKS